MIGAICATVTVPRSPNQSAALAPKISANEPLIATAKVWTSPISSEAANAPAKRTKPTDDNDDKQNRSKHRCHRRLRHKGRAGDHAGKPGERGAGAEHRHKDVGTSWPSIATVFGCVSEA